MLLICALLPVMPGCRLGSRDMHRATVFSADVLERVELAEQHLERAEFADALRVADQILGGEPACYLALRIRQDARSALDQEEDVLSEARRGVHDQPRDPLACLLLARLLTGEDRDLQVQLLERALDVDPRQPFVQHGMGMLFAREGRFEEAEEQFSRALERYPEFHRARLHRALVRDQLADFEGAAEDYSLYLRTRSGDLVALYNLASITHRELHRPDEAEELYRVLLDIDDGITEAVVGLAVCLTEQQRYEAAEALYLSIRDREPSALFNLGMLYQEHLGRPGQAQGCFEEFLALTGELAERQSLADRWIYAPVRLSELGRVLSGRSSHAEARR